jgi:sirohydrochlorin cobaltochelatase
LAIRSRIILFAHGSKDPGWKSSFEGIARLLCDELGSGAACLAFLQFAEPTLSRAVEQAAEDGIRKVFILPLFLSSGGHVLRDLPEQVERAKEIYPEIELSLLQPIGEHPGFGEFTVGVARSLLEAAPDRAESTPDS